MFAPTPHSNDSTTKTTAATRLPWRPLLLWIVAAACAAAAAFATGCAKPAGANGDAAGAGGAPGDREGAGGAGALGAAGAGAPEAIVVDARAVTEIDVPQTLRLPGELRGQREARLAANAAGRVLTVHVERGDVVKAGQVLARLDVRTAALQSNEARAQADSVRAQEAQARAECERYERLQKSGAVTALEADRIATQCRTLPLSVKAATARVNLAQKGIADGVIRAPFAGTIVERFVEVGEYVRVDSPVVLLVQSDTLRLDVAVPEAQLAQVSAGSKVSFSVAAFRGRLFEATVRTHAGAVRRESRDLTVEAMVDNRDGKLLPGMFADVELVTGTRKLPALPREAVLTADGQSRAFFVVDGRLEARLLATVPEVDGLVPVTRGASAGDRVAVGNVERLTNGQRAR